jgi:hypothetical protein
MDAKVENEESPVQEVHEWRGRAPLPETFNSLEELAEFWDTHSTADYEEFLGDEEVQVEMGLPRPDTYYVVLEKRLGAKVDQVARQHGVSIETLVNLWIQEKLTEEEYRKDKSEVVVDAV